VNYGEVKTQFTALLNRRDITPSLIETFMSLSIQRIQREVRIPPMETVVALETDGTALLSVPGDLLQFISVHTNNTTYADKLTRTDLQTILKWSKISGIPRYYHREAGNLYIGPYPEEGTLVYVHYYQDASALGADSDSNWLTIVAPALLIYGALSYAADYFLDDRKMLFENTFIATKESLDEMAKRDEVENASISPAWSDE
jgi:hypothetical protein